MILVKPSFEIIAVHGSNGMDCIDSLNLIEDAGRTCYKSEGKLTEESSKKFISMILKRGHESVIEHSAMTVKFICDRGVTHELVRHRLCAFSQESTRYCNYKGGVTFVIPPWITNYSSGEYGYTKSNLNIVSPETNWFFSMIDAEDRYIRALSFGWSPQQARSVLPNSLKTEIVVTANFREWRHIFKLRTSKAAHPQMREIMIPLLKKCKELIPIIFDEIGEEND
jgi:thymidylate synthase (FAD)